MSLVLHSCYTIQLEAIWKKYERKDVSHSASLARGEGFGTGSGYQGGGAYGAGQGQPEALILWQAFAQDVQRYTDGDNRNEAEKALLAAELELMAKSEAAEAAALAAHDADDNLGDAKAKLEAKRRVRAAEAAKPIGTRGATVGQIAHAKKVIAQTLVRRPPPPPVLFFRRRRRRRPAAAAGCRGLPRAAAACPR